MSDSFTVQTDSLAGRAPGYDEVRARVQTLRATLVARLDAEGACWGDDDAGHTFAGKYIPPATSALDQLSAVAQGLDTVVTGVYRWATQFQQADDDVAGSM